MPYTLLDLDVAEPLPEVALASHETGLAVLVRRHGKPVGFWMEPLPPEQRLTRDELAERIAHEVGTKLLTESIRDELAEPLDRAGFPSLTVAICTKDRPEPLARCLASLERLRGASLNSAFEVLVVDNAASDARTRDLVATFAGVRYAAEPRPGLDFARNRAVEDARGDLLAFLDDDVVVDAGWLDGLKTAWASCPGAGGFTGQVLPYELETPAQILFEQGGGFRRGFDRVHFGPPTPDDAIYPCGAGVFGTGANMAFRRDVLQALGGFDEALDTGKPLPGGGDHDIFYRVVRAGHPFVYEPTYLVFHQHRRELEALRRQYWSWGAAVMAFVVKHYRGDRPQRPRLRRLVRWWFRDQVDRLVRSLRGRHALPVRMVLAEMVGGVQGLCGEYGRSVRRTERIRRAYE